MHVPAIILYLPSFTNIHKRQFSEIQYFHVIDIRLSCDSLVVRCEGLGGQRSVLPRALKASVEKSMIRMGMRYCRVTTVK